MFQKEALSYETAEDDLDDERTINDDIDAWQNRDEKRSAEASFGSKYVGLSFVPEELDRAITIMIGGACPAWIPVAPNGNFKKNL